MICVDLHYTTSQLHYTATHIVPTRWRRQLPCRLNGVVGAMPCWQIYTISACLKLCVPKGVRISPQFSGRRAASDKLSVACKYLLVVTTACIGYTSQSEIFGVVALTPWHNNLRYQNFHILFVSIMASNIWRRRFKLNMSMYFHWRYCTIATCLYCNTNKTTIYKAL